MAQPVGVVCELMASRGGQMGRSPGEQRIYRMFYTDDESAIRDAIWIWTPTIIGDDRHGYLGRKSAKYEPLGNGIWDVTVEYGLGDAVSSHNPSTEQPGGENDFTSPGDPVLPEIEIDAMGVQQHITQAMYPATASDKTAKRTGDTRTIPDRKGAIGLSKDGVEGCDIIVPNLTWSETWTFWGSYYNWNYVKRVDALIGRVNNATFRTFPAGEVMFLGHTSTAANIAGPGFPARKVVFHFARKARRVDFKISSDFGAVTKEGHEYLCVEYEDYDNGAGLMYKRPAFVFVYEVGPDDETSPVATNQRNFLNLGIGR